MEGKFCWVSLRVRLFTLNLTATRFLSPSHSNGKANTHGNKRALGYRGWVTCWTLVVQINETNISLSYLYHKTRDFKACGWLYFCRLSLSLRPCLVISLCLDSQRFVCIILWNRKLIVCFDTFTSHKMGVWSRLIAVPGSMPWLRPPGHDWFSQEQISLFNSVVSYIACVVGLGSTINFIWCIVVKAIMLHIVY